jgi:hypothetical protein
MKRILFLSVALALAVTAPVFAQTSTNGVQKVECVSGCTGGGGGAGGTTQDTDDGSQAGGQSVDKVSALTQVWDGSVWRRLTFGTAGSASAQVLTVQGIASMTPFLVTLSGTNAVTASGGTFAVTESGTWTMQPGNTANTTPWLFAGTKSNNAAAPSSTNFGALPCLANAATPAWSEDKLVFASCDLSGNLRIISGATAATPVIADAMSTTLKVVSASAATLDSYYCYNPNATVAYVQIFDIAAGSVTLGTSVPKWSIGIPATSAGNLADINLGFATAISAAATTTAKGLTALGTALDCNFGKR